MKLSVTNKDIIRLAAPISLALLIPQVNFLTNNIFLGRVGERELAVNGPVSVFYLMLTMIGMGLNNGQQIQMARRAGEGDNRGLAHIFTNGIMLAVSIALGMMMLSLWFAPLIFGYSLHDNEHIFLSVNYLYIRVWGLPFLLLTQLANSFFIATGQSKNLIYGAVVGTLVNIVLDYILIFGKAGFPEMGIAGAAIASVIAEFCGCVTMYTIFYIKRFQDTYPISFYPRFDFRLSRRSLKVSAPLILQYMFGIGGWMIFFFFVEHLGQKELAASQILRSIFGLVGIVTWAFAATCNTMVSNIIGQGRQLEVPRLVRKISGISISITSVICILLLLFSNAFLSLYRDDPALVDFAVPSLRVIVLATLIMSVSTVVFNAVVGTGNTLINLTIEVTCVCCYLIYCYIVIERLRMPLEWAWGSEFVYWICLLLTSGLYLRSGRWKGKRI
ncbi:MATE family efflux transporter [Chitinophagaceae bacterium MMS25-I14]